MWSSTYISELFPAFGHAGVAEIIRILHKAVSTIGTIDRVLDVMRTLILKCFAVKSTFLAFALLSKSLSSFFLSMYFPRAISCHLMADVAMLPNLDENEALCKVRGLAV